jgi:hypothetical protein
MLAAIAYPFFGSVECVAVSERPVRFASRACVYSDCEDASDILEGREARSGSDWT